MATSPKAKTIKKQEVEETYVENETETFVEQEEKPVFSKEVKQEKTKKKYMGS